METKMENILEIKNLYKSYYENEKKKSGKTEILHGINLCINKGDFIAVMGPSGSGKSTLLYTASGMEKADSGEINLQDKNLTKMNDNELTQIRRDKFGFIFQQASLLKNMNILDNIILLSVKKNKNKKAEIVEKAKSLMEKTGIAELENKEITKVSGGQLQRAGICRALMNNPEILFADEPTGALNSKSSDEIMSLFAELNTEGHTILLVTHDAKVAAKASRIEFMLDGKIVKELTFAKQGSQEEINKRIEEINITMQKLGV